MVCVYVSQSWFACRSCSHHGFRVGQSVMVCVYVSQSWFACRSCSHHGFRVGHAVIMVFV